MNKSLPCLLVHDANLIPSLKWLQGFHPLFLSPTLALHLNTKMSFENKIAFTWGQHTCFKKAFNICCRVRVRVRVTVSWFQLLAWQDFLSSFCISWMCSLTNQTKTVPLFSKLENDRMFSTFILKFRPQKVSCLHLITMDYFVKNVASKS